MTALQLQTSLIKDILFPWTRATNLHLTPGRFRRKKGTKSLLSSLWCWSYYSSKHQFQKIWRGPNSLCSSPCLSSTSNPHLPRGQVDALHPQGQLSVPSLPTDMPSYHSRLYFWAIREGGQKLLASLRHEASHCHLLPQEQGRNFL